MAKYLLIMRGTDESNAAMMAEMDAMITTTRQFIGEMAEAGVLLAAEGLDDPAKGVVVDFGAETPVVTDGPYGETKELFGGFFLLDVSSRDEAVEWAVRVPAARGAKIEVNRAVAVAMASGPAPALAMVDELIAAHRLPGSHLVPTVLGELLARLGRRPEARVELELAARLCANERQRSVLLRKAAELA